MLKRFLDTPSHQAAFLYHALEKDIRFDGRRLLDWRDTRIKLSRDECRSEADVTIGETRVVAIVSGEIIKPYSDRPAEGTLQFSADLCLSAEHAGFTQSYVCRLIERSIKDTECIDLESLTLVAGEQVWSICCDIRVLSFHGNIMDACSLAVMGALRAFRKPEVSIILNEDSALSTQTTFSARNIKLYTEDEREPLPLALHHSPLTITLGIFCINADKPKDMVHFLSDPSHEEEEAMNGVISFSVNSHSEICSIVKPGGIGVSLQYLMRASDIAVTRAVTVHKILNDSLQLLEIQQNEKRSKRLSDLRKFRVAQLVYSESTGNEESPTPSDMRDDGGLNVNDPLLSYNFTHVTTGCTEPKCV